MRKYVIGFVVGVLCASVAPAFGAVNSLVGKKVSGEYTVQVDGATLPSKSVAIDGTTYAPLRAIGEAIGYDVSFENKIVVFSKKTSGGDAPVSTDGINSKRVEIEKIVSQLDALNKEANQVRNQLMNLQLQSFSSTENADQIKTKYEELSARALEIESQIKDLEAQKAVLEAQQ